MMARFASGKDAYGISDRSGFRYRLRDMRKEWNGLLVGKDEWERKEPQLRPIRARPDPQALKDPRPDVAETLDVYVGIALVEEPYPLPIVGYGLVGVITVVTT